MLCFKFGENWPYGSWEEDENMKKVYENDKNVTTTTDDGQMFSWAWLRWAKNN